MDREIKAAFAKAFHASLRSRGWDTIDRYLFEDAYNPHADPGEREYHQDIDTAIEQGLAAAFETADYCPSCLEIVPVRDIVLERCLDCWDKLGCEDRNTQLSIAYASDGVDRDTLARLEKKLGQEDA